MVTEEYRRRLAARREAVARHEQQFRTLGYLRLLTVVAGAALAWVQIWTLPVAVSAFLALLIWHERIARSAALEHRAIAFYERGLSRLEGTWARRRAKPARDSLPLDTPTPATSTCSVPGSMFHRINSARTVAGEEVLAQWLQFPATIEELTRRHEAVRELIPRLDLREELALLGEDVRSGLHAPGCSGGASRPAEAVAPAHRILAAALSLGLLATFSGFMLQFWGKAPVLLFVLGELALFTAMRARLARILGAVEMPAHDLGVLAGLIGRVESEEFTAPLLRELIARIRTEGDPLPARSHACADSSSSATRLAITDVRRSWPSRFSGPCTSASLSSVGVMSVRHPSRRVAFRHGRGRSSGFHCRLCSRAPRLRLPRTCCPKAPCLRAESLAHPSASRPNAVANDVRLDGELRLLW